MLAEQKKRYLDITQRIIDGKYESFGIENTLVAVHADGKRVVALNKLLSPTERFDGRKVSFELTIYYLSSPVNSWEDVEKENFVTVSGSETELLSRRELVYLGIISQKGKLRENVSLFDCLL